jgi:hypothetical protein
MSAAELFNETVPIGDEFLPLALEALAPQGVFHGQG